MSFSGIKMQKKEDCTLGDSYTSLRPSSNKLLNGLIQHPLRVKLRHSTHNRVERRISQKVERRSRDKKNLFCHWMNGGYKHFGWLGMATHVGLVNLGKKGELIGCS